MKHHALEIYISDDSNEALCFLASPAYGEAILSVNNASQRLTLNDGVNRVRVAVVGGKLPIEAITRIAREALTA